MAPRTRKAPGAAGSVQDRVRDTLAALEESGTKRNVEGMARYGIVAKKAFGVSVADIRALAKRIGKDHELALALWRTGWHEAKFVAVFVDDPARVTPAQMDRWAESFENWADCDAACFHLFDKTPHAFTKIREWASRPEEFVKRAAFALLASVALHQKGSPDAPLAAALELVDRAANDDRNFVKKGVVWAMRSVAGHSPALRVIVLARAKRLAASKESTPRWIGKTVLRELKVNA